MKHINRYALQSLIAEQGRGATRERSASRVHGVVLNRRALLASSASILALAACAPTASGGLAQYIADAQGIVAALIPLIPAIALVAPKIMTPAKVEAAMTALGLAQAALGRLSANMPVTEGATVLMVVEGYINAVLNTISFVVTAADAAIPALRPYVVTIQAVVVLVQVMEAFLNATLARAPVLGGELRAKAIAPAMTVPAARAALRVPTK
jgi:hypothetical protein